MSHFSNRFENLEPRTLLSAVKDVTVMSQNLYFGADLTPAIQALASGDGAAIVGAVSATYAKVVATNFPERAKAIANEVAAAGPDLIGLQEAALWRTGPADSLIGGHAPATNVQYDFVQILVDALAAHGLHYAPVVISENFDAEAPGFTSAGLQDIRITDREAILARTDLKTSELKLSDPLAGHFAFNAVLPLPSGPFTIQRGYAQVDAKVRGKSFRFISAHLDSDFEPVRQVQAGELLAGPAQTNLPVVLLGDFNAPADGTSPTYTGLVAAGLTDSWTATHAGANGFTWGQNELLNNPVSTADQRIDFVFTRGGISPLSMDIVGDTVADKTPSGLWPSDHAGLVATLVLSNKPVTPAPFCAVSITRHDHTLADLLA
ncbi:MAG: Endonuclease/exonuclease/phosphatase [Phycisphaerales bacterium]|nr:Endonuclease/exonuclease/phosphatase [Phycisphaerales bacterium]